MHCDMYFIEAIRAWLAQKRSVVTEKEFEKLAAA